MTKSPTFTVSFDEDEWGALGMMPWFSYTINVPTLPLPSLSQRGPMQTARLTIRPIVPSDLDGLHRLRSQAETQNHSTSRGAVDATLQDTRDFVARLNEDEGQSHWYFGAFLTATGALVGEGGLPDVVHMMRSGRPEAEILVDSRYWRRGYGSEMFDAIVNSWWNLPRSPRRQQLLPALVPDKEPGDEVVEGVGFVWEEGNLAAASFFPKMFAKHSMRFEFSGTSSVRDERPARLGRTVTLKGGLATRVSV